MYWLYILFLSINLNLYQCGFYSNIKNVLRNSCFYGSKIKEIDWSKKLRYGFKSSLNLVYDSNKEDNFDLSIDWEEIRVKSDIVKFNVEMKGRYVTPQISIKNIESNIKTKIDENTLIYSQVKIGSYKFFIRRGDIGIGITKFSFILKKEDIKSGNIYVNVGSYNINLKEFIKNGSKNSVEITK